MALEMLSLVIIKRATTNYGKGFQKGLNEESTTEINRIAAKLEDFSKDRTIVYAGDTIVDCQIRQILVNALHCETKQVPELLDLDGPDRQSREFQILRLADTIDADLANAKNIILTGPDSLTMYLPGYFSERIGIGQSAVSESDDWLATIFSWQNDAGIRRNGHLSYVY